MRYELNADELVVYFTRSEVNAVLRRVNDSQDGLQQAGSVVVQPCVAELVYSAMHDHVNKQ